MKDSVAWFHEDVLSNYQVWRSDQLDETKARNLALSLHHFHEKVFGYCRLHDQGRLGGARNQQEFLGQLLAQCPALEVLRDVADASKHHSLARKTARVWTPTDAITHHGDRLFVAGDWNCYFDDVVEAAIAFWRVWLDLPPVEYVEGGSS